MMESNIANNLKNTPLNKEDIDLIVVATSSPEQTSPSTACTIHKKLGIKKDIPMKSNVDQALEDCPSIKNTFVVKNPALA